MLSLVLDISIAYIPSRAIGIIHVICSWQLPVACSECQDWHKLLFLLASCFLLEQQELLATYA